MKKSKNIMGANRIAQIIVLLMLLLVAVASALIIARGRQTLGISECTAHVTVSHGDTLFKLLAEQGVSYADIETIDKILKNEAGISRLRADFDKIIFSRLSADAPVSKIILIPSPWRQVELTCNDGGWQCKTIDIERDTRIVYKHGEIKDGDSFYVAGMRAGIPAAVLADVYDLLAFEMDFERDVRAGQNFSVLYEENYSNSERIDNGRVIAVSFQALRGNVKMYRFRKSGGAIGYYDENGNGAIKSLKRTPINNARVTSSFNLKRRHPVLGFTRAHKGVDFRAGTGTPIPSAGAGRVVKKATDRGYGNYIRIRHNGSYETVYAHMSRFAKGVNIGMSVRQGQIIGYVGSTGLSTGPHLHYEIVKDGRHVNPMTVKLPAIDNLDAETKKRFLKIRELIDSAIETLAENPSLFVQL
ncbi:MAG: M23 family metallopeptidase [Rickettsiales bacterium]|jgi:murein DD-endopeptidase MepM/ murein hydrolase activator NlpD|nr:M23 family metallopeptidase [Rickettsiales bacterium]